MSNCCFCIFTLLSDRQLFFRGFFFPCWILRSVRRIWCGSNHEALQNLPAEHWLQREAPACLLSGVVLQVLKQNGIWWQSRMKMQDDHENISSHLQECLGWTHVRQDTSRAQPLLVHGVLTCILRVVLLTKFFGVHNFPSCMENNKHIQRYSTTAFSLLTNPQRDEIQIV